QLFARVFGERDVTFDAAAVTEVLSLPAGQKVYRDTDADGRIDTAYFIDGDPKHSAAFRPMLVKVIDRGDDPAQPGMHVDRYVADWNADGTVDAIVDYIDTDGDGLLDEMAIYDVVGGAGAKAIRVWWSRDIGHSHRLWYTVNYHYEQASCQWKCHFNG